MQTSLILCFHSIIAENRVYLLHYYVQVIQTLSNRILHYISTSDLMRVCSQVKKYSKYHIIVKTYAFMSCVSPNSLPRVLDGSSSNHRILVFKISAYLGPNGATFLLDLNFRTVVFDLWSPISNSARYLQGSMSNWVRNPNKFTHGSTFSGSPDLSVTTAGQIHIAAVLTRSRSKLGRYS